MFLFQRISTMRIFTTCFLFAFAGACAIALPADAGTMSFKTPHRLKDACTSAGGSYNAPNTAGVYSCQFQDGAMIACGGKGEFARTCENTAPKTILNPILVRGSVHSAGESVRAEPAFY
jgi:hypothetical protein